LFFFSFNMIIPELPAHMGSLGGEKYLGLHIALFTLTAGLSRPFSGKLADTVGRIPVMVFGAGVCFVAGLLYPVATSIVAFMSLRFFHGFSTGFKPTGTSAYVADVVPASRRGEAMGILGVSASIGLALGPAIGPVLASYSLDLMYYTSAFIGILSVMVLIGMKESLKEKTAFNLQLLKISRKDIYEPRVKAPSLVMMLSAFSFGIILTVIPDFSDFNLIENKGYFFVIFTTASVTVRLFAGKASDVYGRAPILKISTFLLTVSMFYLGFVSSKWEFYFAAVAVGLAAGINAPTIFAWTIDLSHPNYRGKAMSTMYIALEIGIGMGALISGWLYGNNDQNFRWAFWSGSLMAFLAFCYLMVSRRVKLHHQDREFTPIDPANP